MIMVIVKVAVMWRKRSDAGVDDGFNNRLGEAPVEGSDQASGHTNSVSDAVEFRYLLTIRYAHSSREQGRESGISWFRGEPSATLSHLTGANLLFFMRSSRMTTDTIYRPATTQQHLQGALEG